LRPTWSFGLFQRSLSWYHFDLSNLFKGLCLKTLSNPLERKFTKDQPTKLLEYEITSTCLVEG
jgi:hypothetical protein